MPRVKPWNVLVVVALFLAFLGLLARSLYEALALHSVAQTTVSLLIVTAFLILAGVAVWASQGRLAEMAARTCPACGSHVYSTVRSSDRRTLLTCFSCGHENLVAA